MTYTRRDAARLMLSGIAGGAVWCSAPSAMAEPRKELLLLNEQVGDAFALAVLDMENMKHARITLPFKPHSFVQDPRYPGRVWSFEKWGPHAAVVDVVEQEIIALLKAKENRWFFGHGVHIPNTRTLLASEVSTTTYGGHLVGYDMDTFQIVTRPEVCRGQVHDVKMLPSGDVVFASGGVVGGPSMGDAEASRRVMPAAVVQFDVQREAVIQRMETDEPEQVINHLALLSENRVLALASNFYMAQRKALRDKAQADGAAVGTLPGTDDCGHVFVATIGEKALARVPLPDEVVADMRGEVLSSAHSAKDGYIVVTNPLGVRMLVLREQDLGLIDTIRLPVGSVVLDAKRKRFVAGAEQGLFALDDNARTAEGKPRAVKLAMGVFNASHSTIIRV